MIDPSNLCGPRIAMSHVDFSAIPGEMTEN